MPNKKNIGKVESISKKWLNGKEAAAYLGCSLDFLEILRNKAEISFSRYGNKMIWYEVTSIDKFLNRNKVI